MDDNSEINTLSVICREGKAKGQISGKSFAQLYDVFGKRFIKALATLKENRVKKYVFKPSGRIVWIVIGRERDYLIMPEAEFCMCNDFYFRVLDKKIHLCYHLIAQKIASNIGWFKIINETDELYDTLMNEWKKATA